MRLCFAASTIRFRLMMKFLRKHRHWLMGVIAILSIPFIFYFVRTPDYGVMGSDQFARVYDRNISMLEKQQNARLFGLASDLGMSDFLQSLIAGAKTEDEVVLNLLVLRHEADRLGIRPSSSEIAEVVRKLPAFQGESGFDMKKFSDFVQNGLAPNGLGEEHIEQLRPYLELGFNHLVFHAPGNDQSRFLQLYASQILPRIRERWGHQ